LGVLENRVLEKVFGPEVEEARRGWIKQHATRFIVYLPPQILLGLSNQFGGAYNKQG
jgi:hypothetical protein